MPAAKKKRSNFKTRFISFCLAVLVFATKTSKSLFKYSKLKFVNFKRKFKGFVEWCSKCFKQRQLAWTLKKAGYWTFWKPKVSFVWNILIIIFVYGLAVNYVCSFFWGFPLTFGSCVAFGLSAYFIKIEIVDLIIKIRGPKAQIINK